MEQTLVLRGALVWGREADGPCDIRIAGGRIAGIGPGLDAPDGADVVDLDGCVVFPGLVDAHCHVDKTLWGGPWVPHPGTATLLEQIAYEEEQRDRYGVPSADYSAALLTEMARLGTTHMRTHIDVDPGVGLRGVENVREAVRRTGDLITMEQVAFPQRGMVRKPGTRELLEEALKTGVEVIGGLDPAGVDNDPVYQLDAIFALADKYRAKIDIHLHDRGTLGAWQFDLIIERTAAHGMQGRVTISHGFALADAIGERRQGLVERLAEQRIALTTVAPASGTPPLRPLRAAGVTVGAGNDGVRDLWSPYGSGDMLQRAMELARRMRERTDADVELALRAATYGGADVLGVDGYGLAPGDHADLVAARARNVAEAVVSVPQRALVVKAGRITVRDGTLVRSTPTGDA